MKKNASPSGSGDRSPFKDLTNISTDGDAAIKCNQPEQQKKTSGQGWYARLSPDQKTEYLEKLRTRRQQKKASTMDVHPHQTNVLPKKNSGQSWYARLSPEDKKEYLMKLRMTRLQKKASQPSNDLPGWGRLDRARWPAHLHPQLRRAATGGRKMSEELDLVNYVSEENKRRKRRRIMFMKLYFESTLLAMAYLSTQRLPRDLGSFTDDEHKLSLRKYLLKDMYDGTEVACYDQLRLTKRNFHDLCAMLREKCGLRGSVYVAVEEKVAMFLLVVGHGLKMRLLRGQYKRSLWTISSHFSEVLKAILCLHGEFIKLPDPSIEPPNDYKWKWFPNALGALDGCHINVTVDVAAQGRYRNRKQAITTNVLGVVDWNMKFLYVLPGWEGSASDSRVLRDAMRTSRQDAFAVPNGKYYLGDAGYTNGPGFLTPFRSTRYHLKEWAASAQRPKKAEELYNLRHARARNVVERTFGLWKKRFAILRTASFFDIEDQIGIINACAVLHNYARERQYLMDDVLLAEVDNELAAQPIEAEDGGGYIRSVQVTNEWKNFRKQLAADMFADYLVAHAELEE